MNESLWTSAGYMWSLHFLSLAVIPLTCKWQYSIPNKLLLKMLFGGVHFKEFACVVLVYVVVSYSGVLENLLQ